jgi:hypothetical protein
MYRNGLGCGGVWYPLNHTPQYEIIPDKETPLWNPRSPVMAYWTATEFDVDHAYIVTSYGEVYVELKNTRTYAQGFRAVRDLEEGQ